MSKMDITIDLVSPEDQMDKPSNVLKLPFGTVFTDHMFSMIYKNGLWNNPKIHPYGPLSISPAALCLHYGQGIFEGMKAYRRGDRILLFRPEMNFRRMNFKRLDFTKFRYAKHRFCEISDVDKKGEL